MTGQKLYRLTYGYDGRNFYLGPEMSEKEFMKLCQETAQQATTICLANPNVNVVHDSDIAEEMEHILLQKGFIMVKDPPTFRLPEIGRRHATNQDDIRDAITTYGTENELKMFQRQEQAEQAFHVEFQEKTKLEQTIPIDVLCDDAVCKNCGQAIMQPVNSEDRFYGRQWGHVREGYDTGLCSELVAEPLEGTIVRKMHKYVRTQYPRNLRVE